jgi:hypothetical protein
VDHWGPEPNVVGVGKFQFPRHSALRRVVHIESRHDFFKCIVLNPHTNLYSTLKPSTSSPPLLNPYTKLSSLIVIPSCPHPSYIPISLHSSYQVILNPHTPAVISDRYTKLPSTLISSCPQPSPKLSAILVPSCSQPFYPPPPQSVSNLIVPLIKADSTHTAVPTLSHTHPQSFPNPCWPDPQLSPNLFTYSTNLSPTS